MKIFLDMKNLLKRYNGKYEEQTENLQHPLQTAKTV